MQMKSFLSVLLFVLLHSMSSAQNYTTSLDTFYVESPEYSVSLGLDSLFFPCAVTTPTTGSNFPILVLVHGTSALDMNSSSTKDYLDSIGATYRKAQTFMFSEIADSLSRNGIMVLRYDKRSYTVNCIEKPACWYVDTISPYDYINDIHQAIDYAKTLSNVDTCNIFIAGHSQGGSFVTQVGFDRSDVRGVLDMAGTAQPIDSVTFNQTEFVDGDPLGADILRQQFDSLRNGLWPMTDTLYNYHFSPRFWLDWLSHSDSAVFVQQNSTKPTALMYGTIDKFVPPSIHFQIWQDSVARPNVAFELFTDLDHLFGTEYDSTMSPQVLDFMANWIHDNSDLCGAFGLDENESSKFSVYPNPTSEVITLYSENSGNASYQIIDLNGSIKREGKLGDDHKNEINISELPKGCYLLKVDSKVIKILKN